MAKVAEAEAEIVRAEVKAPVTERAPEPVIVVKEPEVEILVKEMPIINEKNVQDLGEDIISELEKLNSDGILPDDGFNAYGEEEAVEVEDDSEIDIIHDTRKILAEQEDDVIEINDTISIDSLSDEALYQARGYRPIKVNMPRKNKSIVASERYVNDILNKKLK